MDLYIHYNALPEGMALEDVVDGLNEVMEDGGVVCGRIVSMIYLGNHYQVLIRTEDDEDFVVETEYTWNEDDRVSVNIPAEKIRLKLRGEASKYVKN